MSGGYFDYNQHHIVDIADSLERIIANNNEDGYSLSEETIDEFAMGIDVLWKAAIYAQRIDRLLSGDDGEETFHKRLKEDLKNANL